MQPNENALTLSGYISEFPLLEVIQFLGMTGKSGALRIFLEQVEDTVSLYFEKGNLLHAVAGKTEGLGAFYTVLELKTGYFKFMAGEAVPMITIEHPLSMLLLESQRRSDELNHLKTLLPPDISALFIEPEVKEVPRLDTFEWKVVAMINGRRSIGRICEKIGDELAVKKAILSLLKKRLINTRSADDEWKGLVPLLISSEKVKTDRQYPPLLRTNLLLKSIDGQTTLWDLMYRLDTKENDLVEDIRLLYDSRWIEFSTQQETYFQRLINEM